MRARPGNIFLTSDKPRVDIVPCAPHVRQHAIVLFSEGDRVIRQRALDEIKRLADEAADNGAFEVLQQFEELKKA
jgi:antitoxin (DNA-binding transcriptional repressor) of toxin-antitoxin stability system